MRTSCECGIFRDADFGYIAAAGPTAARAVFWVPGRRMPSHRVASERFLSPARPYLDGPRSCMRACAATYGQAPELTGAANTMHWLSADAIAWMRKRRRNRGREEAGLKRPGSAGRRRRRNTQNPIRSTNLDPLSHCPPYRSAVHFALDTSRRPSRISISTAYIAPILTARRNEGHYLRKGGKARSAQETR